MCIPRTININLKRILFVFLRSVSSITIDNTNKFQL